MLLAATAALFPSSAQAGLMPRPPHVTIHENTPCPDYLPEEYSCTDQESGEIWLLPGADRFERQHELGHLFDAQVLTDADRAWFTTRLGFATGTPWFEDYGQHIARAMPGEQFADAYAACALSKSPSGRRRGGIRIGDWTTAYGYYPTARQHRRACNAIVVLALVRA